MSFSPLSGFLSGAIRANDVKNIKEEPCVEMPADRELPGAI